MARAKLNLAISTHNLPYHFCARSDPWLFEEPGYKLPEKTHIALCLDFCRY